MEDMNTEVTESFRCGPTRKGYIGILLCLLLCEQQWRRHVIWLGGCYEVL